MKYINKASDSFSSAQITYMERFLVMLKFSCNIDYIPVSVDFIENYMPEANGAYVKVYPLALSLAVYGYEMSASSIASQLNLLESDVINAFDYWNKKGALKYDKDSGNISFSAKEENMNVSISTKTSRAYSKYRKQSK